MDENEKLELLDFALRKAVSASGRDEQVLTRKMFGGRGYFLRGVIFAAYLGSGLALKMRESDRDDARAMLGASQADYFKEYVEIPMPLLDDTETLAVWVDRSIAYALTSARKGKR